MWIQLGLREKRTSVTGKFENFTEMTEIGARRSPKLQKTGLLVGIIIVWSAF